MGGGTPRCSRCERTEAQARAGRRERESGTALAHHLACCCRDSMVGVSSVHVEREIRCSSFADPLRGHGSNHAGSGGDQQGHLDADLFVAYLGALVAHHEAFATFLYDRFPPRLKVATAAWLDTHPLESRSAPPHPFAMQEYRVEATERATTEEKEAGAADSSAAAPANHNGDLYVLATVPSRRSLRGLEHRIEADRATWSAHDARSLRCALARADQVSW